MSVPKFPRSLLHLLVVLPILGGLGACSRWAVFPASESAATAPQRCQTGIAGCDTDADQDGVVDLLDQCARTVAGIKVDSVGCEVDSDCDGVFDGPDHCPATPLGQGVDARGCPPSAAAPAVAPVAAAPAVMVLRGVDFEYRSARLTEAAKKILDASFVTLSAERGTRYEVAGHTDSRASETYNRQLSQQRADSVKAYLVGKGIDAARLDARGYGESQPLVAEKDDASRAANRRVELRRR